MGSGPAGDLDHEGIVGIEDRPALGPRDPADRGLHLGQLGQRVDALEVEVIRADVGEDAGVVGLVAHSAQDDPAAGRLEDGDVDVRPAEDLVRAARTGPVARVDHPLIDQDPVRGRRADMAAGQDEDVADQPGDRALAVGPADRDDRDPAIGVADPRRWRGAGLRDPRGPALELAALRPGQPGGPRRRDVPFGERQAGVDDRPGPLRAGPREGHDPVARIGRPVDGQAGATLVVRPPAGAGSRSSGRRSRRATRATGPAGRDGRGRACRAHAGRTRSAAGRWPARSWPPARAGRRMVPRAGGSR